MKYCGNCKMIFDSGNNCPHCDIKLSDKIQSDDKVLLVSLYSTEVQKVERILNDEKIYFVKSLDKQEELTAQKAGYDTDIVNIYVSFKDFDTAKEILYSLDEFKNDEQRNFESQDMSPKKRAVVKVFSILMFLIIIWIVVAGADFVADLLKSMFI